MKWTVTLHRAVQKQLPKLPGKVLDTFERLLADIEFSARCAATGRIIQNWLTAAIIVT